MNNEKDSFIAVGMHYILLEKNDVYKTIEHLVEKQKKNLGRLIGSYAGEGFIQIQPFGLKNLDAFW